MKKEQNRTGHLELPETYKAIVVEQNGDSGMLKLKTLSLKPPKEGQVLIRVIIAGVNFVDIYQRRGFQPMPLPFTLGVEGAGIVEAVGSGVTNVKRNDRVAFARQQGAYAEAIIVSAENLIPLPDDITFEQGAAFPLQGMTAHYLINDYRKPSAGDVVLIHAAAGGVGLLLVQWARHLGATVIGTVSSREKAQIARNAGAHHIIINTEQDFAVETMRLTNGHGADLIIDGVGHPTFDGDLKAVAVQGHIVVFGAAGGVAKAISPNAFMERSISVSGGDLQHFIMGRDNLLRRAGDVIDGIQNGWLQIHISKVLPLQEAAFAHHLLESRQTTGKLILSIDATK